MWPGKEVSPAEPGTELVHVATVVHLRRWRYLFPFHRMSKLSRLHFHLRYVSALLFRNQLALQHSIFYRGTNTRDALNQVCLTGHEKKSCPLCNSPNNLVDGNSEGRKKQVH